MIKEKKKYIFTVLLVDRIFGIKSFIIICFLSFMIIFNFHELIITSNFLNFSVEYLLLGILFFVIVTIYFKDFLKKSEILKLTIKNFGNTHNYFVNILLSIISHLLYILGLFILVKSNNIDISFGYLTFVLSLSVIISIIPISFLGITMLEISSFFLLTYNGMDDSEAFKFIFLIFFIKFLISCLGGVLIILKK